MNLKKEFVGDGLGIKCPKRPLPVNVVLQRPGHPWITFFKHCIYNMEIICNNYLVIFIIYTLILNCVIILNTCIYKGENVCNEQLIYEKSC